MKKSYALLNLFFDYFLYIFQYTEKTFYVS
jgi:hypothetical protein